MTLYTFKRYHNINCLHKNQHSWLALCDTDCLYLVADITKTTFCAVLTTDVQKNVLNLNLEGHNET